MPEIQSNRDKNNSEQGLFFLRLNDGVNLGYTICPRSRDPYYIVTYYVKGSRLLGHRVLVVYRVVPSNMFAPRGNLNKTADV